MHPRFRHRINIVSFATFCFLSLYIENAQAQFMWIEQRIPSNSQYATIYSWAWPFFSSSILNIISSIFVHPYSHFDNDCWMLLCVCNKKKYLILLLLKLFHPVNIFYFNVFTIKQVKRYNCWPLYVFLMRLFRIFTIIIAINFREMEEKSKTVYLLLDKNSQHFVDFFFQARESNTQNNFIQF